MENIIKPQDHLETLIGSLNKLFLNARNKGIIKAKELSLLNLIYKILSSNCLGNNISNNNDYNKLLQLYYTILNKYSFLCKANITRDYYTNVEQVYTPHDYIANTVSEIFYWQEEDYNITNSYLLNNISNTNFYANRPSDSYANFETGKDILYNNIGRIVFLATEAGDDTFEIRDINNNIINSQFDINEVPSLNSKLFVSKNIFSHGTVNFKIKKL